MKRTLTFALGVLCTFALLFGATSCKEVVRSGHYVTTGTTSPNMAANIFVQSAVTAAIQEYNTTEMAELRTDEDATSVFRKFVSETKTKIEAMALPTLDDTWVDLNLMNLSEEIVATERLTIE